MRISHKGNAVISTLAADITSGDLVISAADLTNWPDGAIGPFYASINKGKPTEEKILCSGRTGNTLQVQTRGVDDTVAQAHAINSTIEHVWTAAEADAANIHQETTDGAHGYPAASNVVTLDGAQVITGAKTLETPHIEGGTQAAPVITGPTVTGGEHTGAVKLSVAGAQAEAEFRVRNTYIGTGVPDNALGNDGDLFISKA